MYSKILYPTDFSNDAGKALEYIKGLQSSGTTEVIVFHVVERGKIIEQQEILAEISEANFGLTDIEDAEKKILNSAYPKLKKLEKELTDLGIKAEVVIKKGIASKEIIKTAEQTDSKLIVMGYTGRGMLERLFLGSTVRHVIEASPVSVLVVK